MRRARWWSMYLTSLFSGHLLGIVLLASGARFREPMHRLVDRTARQHAAEAADKIGPYLAGFTFFGSLLGIIVMVIAGHIWWPR